MTSHDTHRHDSDTGRVARLVALGPVVALLTGTVAVATVTFVLSFYGLRDYGWRVAGVPRDVAWFVPVGVDLLSIVGVASTFALRSAPWRPRAYAWLVFGVAVAASMLGNLSHADAHDLTWQGRIGATAWPVFLALSAHLVVVVWRHVEHRDRDSSDAHDTRPAGRVTPATRPTPARTAPAQSPVAAPNATPRPDATPQAGTGGRVVAIKSHGRNPLADRAVAAYRADPSRSLRDIARELETNPKNVERWTRHLRQAETAADPEPAAAAT